jgi:hypothetical protein
VRLPQIINFLGRLLIVIAIATSGFAVPAMASNGPPDCLAMMQAGQTEAPQQTPDLQKICPFAGLCATAGYFVGPKLPQASSLRYSTQVATLVVDDTSGQGLGAIPLLHPPKS